MRLLPVCLSLCWLMVACGPQSPETRHVRAARTVLLMRGPAADSAAYAHLLSAVCALTDTGYLTVDTSSQVDRLLEDSLLTYSAVVMLGWAGEDLLPQPQNHLARYVQAGGGLLCLDGRLDSRLAWPWWQDLLRGPGTDSLRADSALTVRKVADMIEPSEATTAKAAFTAFPYDGGRVVRADSTAQLARRVGFAEQVQRSLVYLIGDNSYDYSHCRVAPAPQDTRFTIEVLDEYDIDEPMELTVLPDGRVLFIERRGRMKLYSPEKERSQVIHTFDVCTSGNYEDGLLGLTQDPDFAQNGYLYLYYSPGSDCERPQTLSRFILQDDSLLLDSEKVILEVGVQRETCCHSGGSVTFGPDGYLWLSTGDNTSSKESDGYTPIDERPGRGPFDAQKSSGNTHDLRGKVLRIALTDSGGYTIPEGNLFPPDGSRGRPEIYAMGCRNPFRISVDHATGWVYWGDVGPDVGDSSRYGPRSYDEWNQGREAGNYGWPYFTADNRAYPDRDFAVDTVGPSFDPLHPVNESPYNTGRRELPPAQPAMIWYPYAESDTFPMLGTGSRSAMAGPVFRQALYDTAEAATAFPAYYEGKLFIYEWARSWIKVVSFDSTGALSKIEPFLPGLDLSKPIDLEFGPDGSLYLLEYGQNYFLNNPGARLVRIEHAAGNRLPVPKLLVDAPDGAAPHEVNLSAYFTYDHDPADTLLRYYWQLTQDSVVEDSGVEVCFTYEKPGVYHPRLWVVDQAGDTAIAEAEVRVGNEPPRIEVAYEGNHSFYLAGQAKPYEVRIQDPEDEAQGGIAADRAEVKWVYVSDGHDLEVMLGEGEMPQGDPRFYQGLMLIRNSDCRTCHANEDQSVGPSYLAVAERYVDKPGAVAYLAQKVISGGNGNWGERIMAAHPQLSLADAKAMVQYILSLSNPAAAGQPVDLAGTLRTPAQPGTRGAYLLAATYTDGGTDSLPPLSRRETLVLRHPRLQAEDADLASPWMRNGVWGPDRDVPVRYGASDQAYMAYRQVDGTGLGRVQLYYLPRAGGSVSLHLDAPDGAEVGRTALPKGRSDIWRTASLAFRPFEGQRDLYFVFHKPGSRAEIAVLDWVEFRAGVTP